MLLKEFQTLPEDFKTDSLQMYYDILSQKKTSLFVKRCFDFIVSLCMILICALPMIIIAIAIKLDSTGSVFYRQERITKYGKAFRIYKFRTMVSNADKLGTLVTVNNDARITKVGRFLRKYRLDELPQLINILFGDMSFVGTRPEVRKYVDCYEREMLATLLMPAGVTSLACIHYKDEETLLQNACDADETYVKDILPEKMKYNLEYIKKFSFWYDIKLLAMTVWAVVKS